MRTFVYDVVACAGRKMVLYGCELVQSEDSQPFLRVNYCFHILWVVVALQDSPPQVHVSNSTAGIEPITHTFSLLTRLIGSLIKKHY